jgi:polyphenol oxidase
MSGALLRPDWPAPAGVMACSTLRRGAGISLPPFDHFNLGARCGDHAAAVAANRAALRELAGLPSAPRWLAQVHGIAVHRCGAECEDGEPEADAAITAEAGVVLAVLTADCLPLLFCSEDGNEIAAAHAGWRGLAGGVLEATVREFSLPVERYLAWLGPAAGPQAYEVGDEVRAAFVDVDRGAAAAFAPTRPGHWFCDLYALARRRLQELGLQRIHGGGFCTISDPARFFSHRRDGRSGRMASLIWRRARI